MTKPDNSKPRATKKVSITIRLDPEVLDHVKRAAYWTPGATLGGLVEDALRRELARLEKGRGEAFPKLGGKLRTGRPLKT